MNDTVIDEYGTFGYDKLSLDELNAERVRVSTVMHDNGLKPSKKAIAEACRRLAVIRYFTSLLID